MNIQQEPRQVPPGQIKIENALRMLLAQKDFNSITTAEIARTSGVNEALIYRYFKDKRGLLHQVLANDLKAFVYKIKDDFKNINGALPKLHRLIRGHINYYAENRIFAKILLLEVRNHPAYFESETYRIVQYYGGIILELVEAGIRNREIRNDLSPKRIRQVILGGIEHLCLPGVIFGQDIPADEYARDLCEIISHGVSTKNKKEA
ncbi:MAG: TetR/AcrR family transcriptional regulator [Desulfosalsimonas sp.]